MPRYELSKHEQKKLRNMVIAFAGGLASIYGMAINEWPIVVGGGAVTLAVLFKGLLFHMKKAEKGNNYTKTNHII